MFKKSSFVTNSGVLDINCSDHEAIYVTRKKSKERYNTIKTEGRYYRNYDREKFQQKLRECNWEALQDIQDVDEKLEITEITIRNHIDKSIKRD